MTKQNLKVEFNNGKCLIKDASNVYQVVVAGYEEDGLCRIKAKEVGESALMTTTVYQSKLWHHVFVITCMDTLIFRVYVYFRD